MKWFEPIIIVCAITLVLTPIITHFIKKKKGTLRCECGHLRSECTHNCATCMGAGKACITYVIKVDGMKCPMCESHINDAIRKNFNVSKVRSSRKEGTTTVISDQLINVGNLRSTISGLGYTVSSIKLSDIK